MDPSSTVAAMNAVPSLAQAIDQYGMASAIVLLSIAVVFLWRQNHSLELELRGIVEKMSAQLERSTRCIEQTARVIEQNNRVLESMLGQSAVNAIRHLSGEHRIVGGE